jgi:tetratricopeptide (TPR) repeat protein
VFNISEMGEVVLHDEVKQALLQVQKNESPLNIIQFIKTIIEKNEKSCSELVLEYGIKLMSDSNELANIDNFKILEEIFLASLECKAFDWSDLTLVLINEAIPKSPKSVRYLAMFKEAKGSDTEAKNLYRELIKANPEDITTYRRLAAYLNDLNLKDEAIETLN